MTGTSGMREETPMLGDVVELSVVVRDLDEAVERFTKLFGLRVHRRDESKTFGFKNAILPTGHRPRRAAAADRSRQGGRPLPGQARRGRLSRRLRVQGRAGV